MTKADLVEKIHTKLGLPKNESSDMLEAVLDIIKTALENGENLKLTRFGCFEVKKKDARVGRNPKTGEAMTIEARRIVTFKTSGLLKAKINKDKV